MTAWRRANPEKWNSYRAKNRPKLLEQSREWFESNPEAYYSKHLEKNYGITVEQWKLMFESQGFACAICRTTTNSSNQKWSTDHCHTTGKVRGILCQPCNTGIGLLKDNVDVLQQAIEYLKNV
jgi:hypothetical protein